jgi:hypothetical protein
MLVTNVLSIRASMSLAGSISFSALPHLFSESVKLRKNRFMSDKLQFVKDYAYSTRSTTELDPAFWSLYHTAKESS